MCTWQAVVLVLEFGYGLVAVVYMLFDCTRLGTDVMGIRYSTRCLASVPGVLLGKQLGRTAVVLVADRNAPSVWWHFYVDTAEVILYLMIALRTTTGIGEVWLIIYTVIPAFFHSRFSDYVALRMRTLLRVNSRLMQTAFASVICVDSYGIIETSSGFDALVDGQAEGLSLECVFAAEKNVLLRLCSAQSDSERVVRRLRTSLISLSKSFQQDVEVRVLSATEHELQSEKNLLGVAIMGERRPFSELEKSNTSFFLEQCLDEVGHIRVGGGHQKANDSIPEDSVPAASADDSPEPEAEEKLPDSISAHYPRSESLIRRRKRQGPSGSASVLSSDPSSAPGDMIPKVPLNSEATVLDRRGLLAYGHTWKETSQEVYLKECSLSALEDLLASWNQRCTSCCHWHDAVRFLSELVTQMQSWHSCQEEWPNSMPSWQCEACSALQFDDESDGCWLCLQSSTRL